LLFPCNQFGYQEPGTSDCARAYYDKRVPPPASGTWGTLDYPMFDKIDVNGPGAHELFVYLRKQTLNGQDIDWNYHKWLIDGTTGAVIEHYEPGVSPIAAQPRIDELIAAAS